MAAISPASSNTATAPLSWRDRVEKGLGVIGGADTAKEMGKATGFSALMAMGPWLAKSFEGQPGAQRLVNAVFSSGAMYRTTKDFIEALKEEDRDIPDAVMNGLTAALGALGIATNEREYIQTAAMLHALFGIAGALEDGVMQNNEEAIAEMRGRIPQTVKRRVIRTDGTGYDVETVPIAEVKEGDELIVGKGGYFPVDGTIIAINGSTDASAKGTINFTADYNGQEGTSEVGLYSELPQGTVAYGENEFVVRATRAAEDSSINRALNLMENADLKSTGTRIDRMLDNVYVPVMLAACGAQFLWAFFADRRKHGRHKAEVERGERSEEKPHTILHSVRKAVEKTASMALRMAPCAIEAARMLVPFTKNRLQIDHGVTIIDDSALEKIKDTQVILVDMNGTLTTGEWEVQERHSTLPKDSDAERAAFRKLAILNAALPEHPTARGIAKAGRGAFETLPSIPGEDIHRHPKLAGSSATVEGARVMSGAPTYFEAEGQPIPDYLMEQARQAERAGKRAAFGMVQEPGQAPQFTLFLCEDPLREGSKKAVNDLRRAGRTVVLVTGSSRESAEAMRDLLNEGEENLPENSLRLEPNMAKDGDGKDHLRHRSKVDVVDEYVTEFGGEKVAILGDGGNDQPAFIRVRQAGGVAAAVASTASAVTKEAASLLVQGIHQWPGLVSLSKDVTHTLGVNVGGVLSWITYLVGSNIIGYDHDKKNNLVMDGNLHEWATVAVAGKNIFDSSRAADHIKNPRLDRPDGIFDHIGGFALKAVDQILNFSDSIRIPFWQQSAAHAPGV